MKNKFVSSLYDFASVLLTAILVVSIIFTFFFKVSPVSGESMENTLHNGENVLITPISNGFDYGDVVVISQPNAYNLVLIKRVIAVGGQTVSFDPYTKRVVVDGVALDEEYIKENMRFSYAMGKKYVVPEGFLFVMGDNRNNSADSRDMNIGLIDERYVVGKVFYKLGDTHIFNKDFKENRNG